jgi:hypothetical protein
MHIHGNSTAVNAASFYSAGQNEKTAAAQRAADVRRKLMKAGSVMEGAAAPEETLMIGQMDGFATQPGSERRCVPRQRRRQRPRFRVRSGFRIRNSCSQGAWSLCKLREFPVGRRSSRAKIRD